MTNIFHLFTVKPVEVADHELPRVQYGDYYIPAERLLDAWAKIKDWAGVADAAEVWGVQLDLEHWYIAPDTKLNAQESYAQHVAWTRMPKQYHQVHAGPESIQEWSDRRLGARLLEVETRRKFGLYFNDLRESLKAEGEGATVDKGREWEVFIGHAVSEGTLPESAKAWACPRSL